MNKSVWQDWTLKLPFMQQTVLAAAVRGPDGIAKNNPVKNLLRWYRRCILFSAMDKTILTTPYIAGGGSFTGPSYTPTTLAHNWEENMNEVVDLYISLQDAMPHHFQMHLLHAFEIVGYHHPDEKIRLWFYNTYIRLVHTLHLWPESYDELNRRLSDDESNWRERTDRSELKSIQK